MLVCNFIFLWCFFLAFQPHRTSWEVFLTILWKSLKRIDVNSLKVWWNSPVKPSGAGLFFLEIRVFIANRFAEIFLTLLRVSLCNLCVSRNLSTSFRLTNLFKVQLLIEFSYLSLYVYFCKVVVMPPFSFLTLVIYVFAFFIRLARGFLVLLIFSKKQLSFSLPFSVIFLFSISFISSLPIFC